MQILLQLIGFIIFAALIIRGAIGFYSDFTQRGNNKEVSGK